MGPESSPTSRLAMPYIWTCRMFFSHYFLKLNLSDTDSYSDGAVCACGGGVEDNYHFFYLCPLFNRQREQLFSDLQN